MTTYGILTVFHVVFTLVALLTGLLSILVNPKGGDIHRKSGRYYFGAYLGVVLSAFFMLTIKFKLFFLALTLFGLFLIVAGKYYAKKQEKQVAKNWWVLSILLITVFVYLVDAVLVVNNFKQIGYGWSIVRLTFALIAFSTLLFELRFTRNRIALHGTMMLLSFIPLVSGLLARIAPSEYIWISWILGYLVFIPLILLWFRKSSRIRALLN